MAYDILDVENMHWTNDQTSKLAYGLNMADFERRVKQIEGDLGPDADDATLRIWIHDAILKKAQRTYEVMLANAAPIEEAFIVHPKEADFDIWQITDAYMEWLARSKNARSKPKAKTPAKRTTRATSGRR